MREHWGTDWSDEKEAEFRAAWDIRIAECPRSACRRHGGCKNVRHCPGLVKYPIPDEVIQIRLAVLRRALMARRLKYLAELEAREDEEAGAAKQAGRRGRRVANSE